MPWLMFLQKFREVTNGIFDQLMLFFSTFGESSITYVLLAFVYWCVDKKTGSFMALNVAVNCTTNQWTKKLFNVDRPWIKNTDVHPLQSAIPGAGGQSFTSGHTARAMSTWGAFAFKISDKVLKIVLFSVVLLVCISRNYVGVHTFWDIMGAIAFCVAGFLIVDFGIKYSDNSTKNELFFAFMLFLICFLPMLKYGCLSNAGYGMGFIAGWLIERHFVNFSMETSKRNLALRFIIGSLGIFYILKAVMPLFKIIFGNKYAGFFTGVLFSLYIMAIFPFFFMNLKRIKIGCGILAFILLVHVSLSCSMDSYSGNNSVLKNIADSITYREPKVVTIGHRGNNCQFPENTLASFQSAIDIGCDFIELDVQLSKDNKLIVYHDGNLSKTGHDGACADYLIDELRSFQIEGQNLCTLEEVFDLIKINDKAGKKKVRIYLELKDIGKAEGFVEQVLSLSKEHKLFERCVFASFQYEYLVQFKAIDSKSKTLLNISNYDAGVVNQMADYYGLYLKRLEKDVVDSIHNAGRKAYVWTVDGEEDIMNCISLGVDGICSNNPLLVKNIIASGKF